MKSVFEFQIFFMGSDGGCHTEYIQALNSQQAADFSRKYFGASQIYNIYREVKNWK